MPTFKLIVFSDPTPGRKDEYNDWYNNTHLDEAMTLPGFQSGQRFRTGRMDRDAPCGFAAIYDIEADSLEDAIASAKLAERFSMPDVVDLTTAYAIPLLPISPVKERKSRSTSAVVNE